MIKQPLALQYYSVPICLSIERQLPLFTHLLQVLF